MHCTRNLLLGGSMDLKTQNMAFPMKAFDVHIFRDIVKACISRSLCNDVENIAAAYNEAPGSDIEKKSTVDQAFKDVLKTFVEENKTTDECIGIIILAVLAVEKGLCNAAVPFIMLSEVLDTITIDGCEKIFEFVEDKVDTWKSEIFYNAGKNYLLRMCNDLLRRLSRSQHIIFCGRIQLFLARLFPLSEKSGLNLMSQFNLDNVTEFTTRAEDYDKARLASESERDESMEEGEMEEVINSITIDYNLYKKFWELQDYFRKPAQCYDKNSWTKFINYSDEVLACFESFKLDEVKSSKRKLEVLKKAQTSQSFFAKYLTSEKLLDLQLSDSHFRRYVLVQFIILFQYLSAQVKFKSSSQILEDEQQAWTKTTSERIFKILKETPPDGKKFAAAIEHILSREENWNNWKNEGCPSYVRESQKDSVRMPQRPQKRSLGEDLKASGGKLIKMGSGELTRLWNLCPDNMAACRAEKRDFLPQVEVFFEDAIEQMDPEAQVEDEYKLVHDSTFAWKSLRLLARRSPHFFALQSTNTINNNVKMSQMLEDMLNKIAKELPSSSAGDEKTDVGDDEDAIDGEKQPGDTAPPSPEEEPEDALATLEQCESLAKRLSADWRKLAAEFNFDDAELDEILLSSTDEPHSHAAIFLQRWREKERDKATVTSLRCALKEVGLVEMSNDVLGTADDG